MNMNKKWFTLIEMLIVIVIIGILAAALIPKLTGVQGRARDVARKSDMQQIASTLATYNLDNGTYPPSNTETTDAAWFANALSGLITNNLMTVLPKETGKLAVPYAYKTYNSASVFTIKALSEWAWVNANWASGSAFVIPNNSTSPNTIIQLFCARVDQGSPSVYTGGGDCKADVIGLEARYIVSN